MSQSLERLYSPNLLDVVFPVVAFLLVIVLPSLFALFVIKKIVSKEYPRA